MFLVGVLFNNREEIVQPIVEVIKTVYHFVVSSFFLKQTDYTHFHP